jgi:hypothetical protein
MNNVDAYMEAYSYKGKSQNAIRVEACKAANHPNVTLILKELREDLREVTKWERKDSVKALTKALSNPENKTTDVVAVIKELNNMHGYNEKNLNLGGKGDKPIPIALMPATADPDTWESD